MLTKRLLKIKDRMFNVEMVTKKEWWGLDKTILTGPDIEKEPIVVRKALAINYVCNNLPINIKDDELIVGTPNMAAVGFGYAFVQYALESEKQAAAQKCLNESSVWGHHPVRYDKLLSLGLSGFKDEITEKLKIEFSKPDPNSSKIDEYRAMLISLDGVAGFASRYSRLALDTAAREKDTKRRLELLKISEICSRVPNLAASSFHEALMSFWLTYCIYHSCMEYLPAGRFDQYMYPYYKYDIENNIITEEQAKDLVGSCLVKFNERVQVKRNLWEDHYTFGNFSQGGNPADPSSHIVLDNSQSYNYGLSANHWLMNMIIGGQTANGNDATNELTYLILNTWAELELVAPVLSVRFFKGSPGKLYSEVVAILVKGGTGEPAIYNDEPIIEGLAAQGIPIEEARDYSNDGCWETLIPGKTDFTYFHIEVALALEYTLFRGKSLLRDAKEGMDTGDPVTFKTFDKLYGAFLSQVKQRTLDSIENKYKFFGEAAKIAPDPLISSMMDDCVEKGLDISQGGARYIFHAPLVTGLSHAADSLAAIKKLVYEEKQVEMAQLTSALKSNFKGSEPLRQMLLNRAPKYGNDDPYVDSIAKQILIDTEKIIDSVRDKYAYPKIFLNPGIGTFESYARFGNTVGASADGRFATESLASNYSPSIGADRSGPTSAVKSATYADLSKYMTGAPVDLFINGNEVAQESGLENMVSFIKSFFELRGQILTITVATEQLFRDAQIHPEAHKGLRVRLGGLSAYFIAIPQKHQEIMIERLAHGGS